MSKNTFLGNLIGPPEDKVKRKNRLAARRRRKDRLYIEATQRHKEHRNTRERAIYELAKKRHISMQTARLQCIYRDASEIMKMIDNPPKKFFVTPPPKPVEDLIPLEKENGFRTYAEVEKERKALLDEYKSKPVWKPRRMA